MSEMESGRRYELLRFAIELMRSSDIEDECEDEMIDPPTEEEGRQLIGWLEEQHDDGQI